MRRAGLAAVVLIVLVLAWSALWAYAAHRAGMQVDALIAAEKTQGRDWTCPNRSISGYPAAIHVSCSDPSFSGQALGEQVRASVAHLGATISLLHPRTVAARLDAPFTYTTSDGQTDIAGSWRNLRVDLSALPDLRTLTLTGSDIAVTGTFGEGGQGGGRAGSLDATFVLSPLPADRPVIDFKIAVAGTDMPPLDAIFGDRQPVSLALVGKLDHADTGNAQTPEDMMDIWRRAGGQITIARSQVVRGAAKVTSTGTLGLDEAHRLRGRLDADFYGLEPILKRYGISGNLAAAGSILSTLFGGGGRTPTPPGALGLPISFSNGRLGIGPIRTDVALQPLY